MAKNILAFFGLMFLTLLVVAGVGLMGYIYDSVGIVELPEEVGIISDQVGILSDKVITIPDRLRQANAGGTPTITVFDGMSEPQWENPLDLLPVATETPFITNTPRAIPTAIPTATPIPPMEPSMYRADTIDRLRVFADTLERWLDHNKKMGGDMAVKNDPQWQSEMRLLLDDIVYTGYALAEVGPPPAEYETVDAWMARIPEQAESLRESYLRALETDDPAAFRKAGEDFNELRSTLTNAAAEMVNLGWVID